MKILSSAHLLAPRLTLALCAALFSALTQAQELKIGVVDTDRILREAELSKTAQTKLEAEFSKREKEIVAMGTSLKSAFEKFNKEAPTLPPAQQKEREKKLVEQEQEFKQKRFEFQENLAARRSEELQIVQDKAMAVIKKLADTEKYSFIVQEAVYFNPKLDITERVILEMNGKK